MGTYKHMDKLIVVAAEPSLQIRRMMKRNKLSEVEAQKRLESTSFVGKAKGSGLRDSERQRSRGVGTTNTTNPPTHLGPVTQRPECYLDTVEVVGSIPTRSTTRAHSSIGQSPRLING